MILENYEFSGQFEPKEGWPMTEAFQMPVVPKSLKRDAVALIH